MFISLIPSFTVEDRSTLNAMRSTRAPRPTHTSNLQDSIIGYKIYLLNCVVNPGGISSTSPISRFYTHYCFCAIGENGRLLSRQLEIICKCSKCYNVPWVYLKAVEEWKIPSDIHFGRLQSYCVMPCSTLIFNHHLKIFMWCQCASERCNADIISV